MHVVFGLHQEDERINGVSPKRPNFDTSLVILKRDVEQGSVLLHYKELSV